MYVRNGANPIANADDRPYHWFDGDGMLQGVYFVKVGQTCQPLFVNRHVLTDVLLATPQDASLPIIPSISTLLGPLQQLPAVVAAITRAVALSALSYAFKTRQAVQRISVANTAVTFHDGRALATCESGPMAWFRLPSLETVGWWDLGDENEPGLRDRNGPLGFMKEWTTAHPKRDPETNELVLYHSLMLPPYLSYSVVPARDAKYPTKRIIGEPVPIPGPRMMHDFAASHTHTVIIDTPLSLDPLNLARGIPIVSFSPDVPARFGIFPRHDSASVRWFNAPSCVIFHTACAYNSPSQDFEGEQDVNVICCRLNSSRLVYAAGNLAMPSTEYSTDQDTCMLYYYQFGLARSAKSEASRSFALSTIPFEFPTVSFKHSMSGPHYVYGCSMKQGSFSAALGSAAKIDCLVKINVASLVKQGLARGLGPEDAVDTRTVIEILEQQSDLKSSSDVLVFPLPHGWYAQESSFVPRRDAASEDDGWLLTYVFDESQLDEQGEALPNARSELWVIDARTMNKVVAKVKLPQRVPYGLHGNWFTEAEINSQRPVPASGVRRKPEKSDAKLTWTEEHLRAAAQHVDEPCVLPVLDRYTVLEQQRELIARERALDDQAQIRTRKTLVGGPGKHWSDKSLDELVPVTLSELRTAAVQFIIESADGRVAPVHLHRWRIAHNVDLNDEFMIDSMYAVKEPSVRSLGDGFCIRIDSPSDLSAISLSSPLLSNMVFKPMRLPIEHKSSTQYKDDGNKFVAALRFAAARHNYTLGIDAAARDDPALPVLLVNRALCHLQLGHPGRAVSDCKIAIALDLPTSLRVKCLWRQALGAYHMEQYDDAERLLVEAASIEHPVSPSITNLQRKVQACMAQQRGGTFDWPALWQSAQRGGDGLRDISEYVDSSVTVQQVSGKGRGLVAANAIKRGNLLLVQKPLALGTRQADRKNLIVGANLNTESVDGYPSIDAISQVAYRWADVDVEFKKKILALASERIPPAMYADDEKLPTGLDMTRLESVFVRNSFHVESLVRRPEFDGDGIHASVALYSTASMMNHSCVGNVTYSFLLGLMFVRARRDIDVGEELVDSYVQAGASLEEREQVLSKHDFAYRRAQQDAQNRIDDMLDRASQPGLDQQTLFVLFEESVSLLGDMESSIVADRPKTLRPSLYSAFRLCSNLALKLGDFKSVIKMEMAALESIGCVVNIEDPCKPRMLHPPFCKDVDAVHSCLLIASVKRDQNETDTSKQWIELARDIERGQAGQELFESRYAEFARSYGLDLAQS
ncbi:hypothetical protein OIV83_004635 [Microbotryomycetes sp. JL201]|nr:hypothetical protein OIV83_004635 [Microbotryomycetes sp. JL201]